MTADEAKVVQEIKSRAESNTHQIEEIKERLTKQEARSEVLYQLSENISLMAQSLQQVQGDMTEVKTGQKELSQKVSTLENAPAKEALDNFKKLKIAAISAVVSGAAVTIAGMIFKALSK